VDAQFYIKTLVKEEASIGANATIVCGHTLGKHCMIGAGSVVTKDIPDYALVIGNSGSVVGWVSEAGKRLKFDEMGKAFYEKSKKTYHLKDGTVTMISYYLLK